MRPKSLVGDRDSEGRSSMACLKCALGGAGTRVLLASFPLFCKTHTPTKGTWRKHTPVEITRMALRGSWGRFRAGLGTDEGWCHWASSTVKHALEVVFEVDLGLMLEGVRIKRSLPSQWTINTSYHYGTSCVQSQHPWVPSCPSTEDISGPVSVQC